MTWLARLKNGNVPDGDATKTTKTVSVVFVAPEPGHIGKIHGPEGTNNAKPAEPQAPNPAGWNVTLAPGLPAATVAKFKAASEALDRQIAEAVAAADPDATCWPNGPAMNGTEIGRFTDRVALFRRRGLSAELAEAMADKLVRRDRGGDDRVLCLECSNLSGRRCTEWRTAGIGDPAVGALLTRLQRCDAFGAVQLT